METIHICIIIVILALVFIYNLDFSQYIVLKLVIPNSNDMGGFAWHLHHVQCLIHLCKIENKIPIIFFHGGYYHNRYYGLNWYHHYFEPIHEYNCTCIALVGTIIGFNKITKLPLGNSKRPFLYTNDTFQKLVRPMKDIKWSECYTYIKPTADLQFEIDSFCEEHFTNMYVIGVHYRGTDKFMGIGMEDLKENKHKNYEDVISEINKEYTGDCVVFVASDEQPFVDMCENVFENVCYYTSSRSTISTSGLEIDYQQCSNSKDCEKLKELEDHSIHRGINDIDPYKKGKDAVIDIWLLSRCDMFFRTHGGNFGSQPGRINPSLIVKKLV